MIKPTRNDSHDRACHVSSYRQTVRKTPTHIEREAKCSNIQPTAKIFESGIGKLKRSSILAFWGGHSLTNPGSLCDVLCSRLQGAHSKPGKVAWLPAFTYTCNDSGEPFFAKRLSGQSGYYPDVRLSGASGPLEQSFSFPHMCWSISLVLRVMSLPLLSLATCVHNMSGLGC